MRIDRYDKRRTKMTNKIDVSKSKTNALRTNIDFSFFFFERYNYVKSPTRILSKQRHNRWIKFYIKKSKINRGREEGEGMKMKNKKNKRKKEIVITWTTIFG